MEGNGEVNQGGVMEYAAVGSSLLSSMPQSFHGNNGVIQNQPRQKYALNAQVMTEQYKSSSISFDYVSKDGDKVSFSMESVEYSRSMVDISAEGSKDDMQKLVEYIKDNFNRMKKELLDSFMKSTGVEVPENSNVEETVPELEIPEYWNAENTSQRIVDFATSFLDVFKGSGDEFLAMMKGAIEEGFNLAREMLGELPDAVNQLVDDTYSLAMEKLDAWASEQGIETVETEMENATV